jgi:hypothetical protein
MKLVNHSKVELERFVRVERMELTQELTQLNHRRAEMDRRLKAITYRLGELDTAENLLEGM